MGTRCDSGPATVLGESSSSTSRSDQTPFVEALCNTFYYENSAQRLPSSDDDARSDSVRRDEHVDTQLSPPSDARRDVSSENPLGPSTVSARLPSAKKATSHSSKRKQSDIDELMVATLLQNRQRLNEMSAAVVDHDEYFLLSMKPLLAKLNNRKKELMKLNIHSLLIEAAHPSCD